MRSILCVSYVCVGCCGCMHEHMCIVLYQEKSITHRFAIRCFNLGEPQSLRYKTDISGYEIIYMNAWMHEMAKA